MIFKNKDSGKCSLFGDKASEEVSKPIDSSVLEGFYRKQSIESKGSVENYLINNSISKSYKNTDDSNAGGLFLGKSSSRSIFSPSKIEIDSLPESKSHKKSGFLPNEKKSVEDSVAQDLLKFKGNFNNASKQSGGVEKIRKDRLSIFDTDSFEKIENKPVFEKSSKKEEKKVSKSLSSKEVSESLFDKLSQSKDKERKTEREKSIDKIIGD